VKRRQPMTPRAASPGKRLEVFAAPGRAPSTGLIQQLSHAPSQPRQRVGLLQEVHAFDQSVLGDHEPIVERGGVVLDPHGEPALCFANC